MNANLVKTVDSVAATRRERLRAYWQLVRKIAEGEKVNPAILDRAMTEAGRSIESLKADVEAVQARYVLAETATKLGPLAHERDKLSKTIDAEDEKLAEATRRHSDAVRPLLLRLQEIQAEEAIATSARDRLISECPYPDALEALNEARSRSTAARQARHNLIVEAENAKRQAGFCDTQADLNDLRGFKREKTAEEEKASRYYQKAADALAKLPAADKEIEAADKLEEAAIETLAAP